MEVKKKSLIALLCLSFMLFNFSFSHGAAESSQAGKWGKWRYVKNIEITNAPKKGDLVKISLDQDVFNNANEDLGDLRVVGNGGMEVPYKLIVEKSFFSERNIYPVRILNNSFSSDGQYNIFVVDFGQKGSLNSSLNILTGSENFKRTVEVSGSNDMQSWNILKTNGYIYDYTDKTANFRASDTEVSYPENTFQYLQVKIFSRGEAPLAVSGAQVSRIITSANKETTVRPQYTVEENSNKRTTDIIINLGKKGWPTSNITLDAGSDNFNREAVVYESDDKVSWRRLGNGYIFNLDTPKFTGANLNVGYSESNKRYLKVEIYNGSNAPVEIRGVLMKTILRSIAFQYGEGGTSLADYSLYYGNSKASFPQYDLERFYSYLDTENYFSAALGGEKENPSFVEDAVPVPPLTERIPYLIEMVLVLVIIVMGFIVFRFMKKVSSVK